MCKTSLFSSLSSQFGHMMKKGGKNHMEKMSILFLACILAGFALIKVTEYDNVLTSLHSVFTLVGAITIIVFSFVLIFKGILALLGK